MVKTEHCLVVNANVQCCSVDKNAQNCTGFSQGKAQSQVRPSRWSVVDFFVESKLLSSEYFCVLNTE
jgi:hypothetical protein